MAAQPQSRNPYEWMTEWVYRYAIMGDLGHVPVYDTQYRILCWALRGADDTGPLEGFSEAILGTPSP